MAKVLPKIRAGSPLVTNAHLNRVAAGKCLAAGMSVEQVAAEWPEVWRAVDGTGEAAGRKVLSQKYDYEIDDGSGRYETNRLILGDSVKAAIKRHKAARARARGKDQATA